MTTGSKMRQALMGQDRDQFLSTRDLLMGIYGKVWGDSKGEKAASAKWEKISDDVRTQFGDNIKDYRFPGGSRTSPVIAFSAVPEFCKLIFREQTNVKMPAVIATMQKYFVGDPDLIPDMEKASAGTEMAIPFEEIMPGAKARAAVIDGVIYPYGREVIQYLTGNTGKRCNEIWRNLPEGQKVELQPFMKKYQFSGIYLFMLCPKSSQRLRIVISGWIP